MKQFIRYLYEYEQGKRVRNVGFVRVEQTEEATLVHIHGKGLRIAGNRQLGLYLFYETDKECVGIPPVSYTHLDVYKRQGSLRGAFFHRGLQCGGVDVWHSNQ